MELVAAANNSAGASQLQYEKTLDSFETKLNNLKNAWNTFLLNIVESDIIKTGIDLITGLLEAINGLSQALTNMLGPLGKGMGSFTKLLAIWGAFRGVKSLISGKMFAGLFAGAKTAATEAGAASGNSFATSFAAVLKARSPKLYNQFFGGAKGAAGASGAKAAGTAGGTKRTLNIKKASSVMSKNASSSPGHVTIAKSELNKSYGTKFGIPQNVQPAPTQPKPTEFRVVKQSQQIQYSPKEPQPQPGFFKSAGESIKGGAQKVKTGFTNWKDTGLKGNWQKGGGFKGGFKAATSSPMAAMAGITAVTTAVGMATSFLDKHIKSTSEKVLAMKAAIDEANASAEENRQILDGMSESQDNYKKAVASLKTLKKGTADWTKALVDVNKQTQDILAKYPELAEMIETTKDGAKVLSDAGWAAYEQKVAEDYTRQTNIATGLNYQKSSLQQAKQLDDLEVNGSKIDTSNYTETEKNNTMTAATVTGVATGIAGAAAGAAIGSVVPVIGTIIGGLIGGLIGAFAAGGVGAAIGSAGISSEDGKNVSNLAAAKGFVASTANEEEKDQFIEQAKSEGYDLGDLEDAIRKDAEAFDKFVQDSIATNAQQEAQLAQMAATAIAGDKDLKDSDLGEQGVQGMAENVMQNYDKVFEDAMDTVTDYSEDQLIQLYAKAMKMTEDEVREKLESKALSEETMQQTIANNNALETLTKTIKSANSSLVQFKNRIANDKGNKKQGNALLKLLTGGELTNTDLEGLNINQDGDINEQIKNLISDAGLNIDDYNIEDLVNQYITAQTTNETLDAYNLGNVTNGKRTSLQNNGLSIAATKNLLDGASREVDGKEDGYFGKFSDLLQRVLENKNTTDEDKEKINNLVSNTDFSDSVAIRNLLYTLSDLDGGFKGLEAGLINAADAAHQFSNEEIQSAVTHRTEAEDIIMGKGSSKVFTEEEYNTLTDNGTADFAEDFVQYGSNWIYQGESILSILAKINQDTTKIANDEGEPIPDLKPVAKDAAQQAEGYLKGQKAKGAATGEAIEPSTIATANWTFQAYGDDFLNSTITPVSEKNGNYEVQYYFNEGEGENLTGMSGTTTISKKQYDAYATYAGLEGKDINELTQKEAKAMADFFAKSENERLGLIKSWINKNGYNNDDKILEMLEGDERFGYDDSKGLADQKDVVQKVANSTKEGGTYEDLGDEEASWYMNKTPTQIYDAIDTSVGTDGESKNESNNITAKTEALVAQAEQYEVNANAIYELKEAEKEYAKKQSDDNKKALKNAAQKVANLTEEKKAIQNLASQYQNLSKLKDENGGKGPDKNKDEDVAKVARTLGLEATDDNLESLRDNWGLVTDAINGSGTALSNLITQLNAANGIQFNIDGTVDVDASDQITETRELTDSLATYIKNAYAAGNFVVKTVKLKSNTEYLTLDENGEPVMKKADTEGEYQILQPAGASLTTQAIDYSGGGSGGGGGGGSKAQSNTKKSWHFNRDVRQEELSTKAEEIEKDINYLLTQRKTTYKEILSLGRKNLKNLKEQRAAAKSNYEASIKKEKELWKLAKSRGYDKLLNKDGTVNRKAYNSKKWSDEKEKAKFDEFESTWEDTRSYTDAQKSNYQDANLQIAEISKSKREYTKLNNLEHRRTVIDADISKVEAQREAYLKGQKRDLQTLINLGKQELELLKQKVANAKATVKQRKEEYNQLFKNNGLLKKGIVDKKTGKVNIKKKNKMISQGIDPKLIEEAIQQAQTLYVEIKEGETDVVEAESEYSQRNNQKAAFTAFTELTKEMENLERALSRVATEIELMEVDPNASTTDIANKRLEQLGLARTKVDTSFATAAAAEQERDEWFKNNADYGKYIDKNTGVVDYAGLEKLRIEKGLDQDTLKEIIQEGVEKTEDAIEASDNINAAKNELVELRKSQQQGAVNFINTVRDAIIKERQDQITQLTNIDKSINDTNSKLISTVQKNFKQLRQDRQNEKAEKDISQMEARLAYLRQNTSAGNLTEIKQLEEQIENSKQSYTDSLIDQKLTTLQEENQKAAEQRQHQISIMQKQLEYDQASGKILIDTYDMISQNVDAFKNDPNLSAALLQIMGISVKDGQLTTNVPQIEGFTSVLSNLIATQSDWMGKSYLEVMQQIEQINSDASSTVAEASTVASNGGSTTEAKASVDYTPTTGTTTATQATPSKPAQTQNNNNTKKELKSGDRVGDPKNLVKGATYRLATKDGKVVTNGSLSWNPSKEVKQKKQWIYDSQVNNTNEYKFYRNVKKKNGKGTKKEYITVTATGNNIELPKNLTKFKTGGIADFTGPAWLDGTKSKPEIILNAKDTQNFIQLKDALSSFLTTRGAQSTKSQTNGDFNCEVHINVEKLSNDYDVDKVAKRVKKIINDEGRYRNVNQITRLR